MSFVRAAWEKWKVLARRFGDFQARLILWLFYYLILFWAALVVKAGKSDPLRLKPTGQDSHWLEWPAHPATLEEARKQS